MRIEERFTVARSPEEVFDFIVDPANLAKWQTIKTEVVPLSDGPPRAGFRVREKNKVGPRRWEQVVEFTEFDRPRSFAVRVIEGPESSGRWELAPDGEHTRVEFTAEAKAPGLLKPLFARQFRGYHENLRRALTQP